MSWVYIIVVIYASVLAAHVAYLGKRIRGEGWRNFTASDHVALESLLLNTVLLIIAVVSLKIAVSTYNDALVEGRKHDFRDQRYRPEWRHAILVGSVSWSL
jgi:hypothetical protein